MLIRKYLEILTEKLTSLKIEKSKLFDLIEIRDKFIKCLKNRI